MSRTVFATIGSVWKRKQLFEDFKYIFIDECHLVGAAKVKIDQDTGEREEKHTMYSEFLGSLPQAKVMGFTATPYRLSSDSFGGSILKFITRTRPRIFHNVVHYVQNRTLFDGGFLSKITYYEVGVFDRNKIKRNSTGADFDERSLRLYYDQVNLAGTLVICIKRLMQIRKNILVFVRFIKEARWLADQIEGAEYITGEMKAEKRDDILERFKSNKLKCLINIGVVAIGFDKPDLETVVLGRETLSLAAYYQWVGRAIRTHPDKEESWVVDLCGNVKTFGKVEDLQLEEQGGGGTGKWIVTSRGRQITNEYFGNKKPQTVINTIHQ